MSWGNNIDNLDQLQHERMIDMLETALDKPETPPPLVITREMRHAVVGEIQGYVNARVPTQFAWPIMMALLDYGCRALVSEPEGEDQ
jgi:hypothetical protein